MDGTRECVCAERENAFTERDLHTDYGPVEPLRSQALKMWKSASAL